MRRKQRGADFVGMFLGILAGLWADSDDLWPRVAVAVLAGLVATTLLRLALRVPVWRNVRSDSPDSLPPYGEPPVR